MLSPPDRGVQSKERHRGTRAGLGVLGGDPDAALGAPTQAALPLCQGFLRQKDLSLSAAISNESL